MRGDREQALKLRLSGKSYSEISKFLGVPKGTLSYWFSGLQLSDKAKERIRKRVAAGTLHGLVSRNKNQTHRAIQRARNARKNARGMIRNITRDDLRLIGSALYWAEGYKRIHIRGGREVTYHAVSLTNSDGDLIKIFLRFLREVCEVPNERIYVSVRIYEHMNEQKVLMFWQKITGLPMKNFRKSYYGVSKSSQGQRPFNRLPYGTAQIRVGNTELFHTIMGWIEGLAML